MRVAAFIKDGVPGSYPEVSVLFSASVFSKSVSSRIKRVYDSLFSIKLYSTDQKGSFTKFL